MGGAEGIRTPDPLTASQDREVSTTRENLENGSLSRQFVAGNYAALSGVFHSPADFSRTPTVGRPPRILRSVLSVHRVAEQDFESSEEFIESNDC